MFNDINTKLQSAISKIQRYEEVCSMVSNATQDVSVLNKEKQDLKEQLDKENLDVENLDKIRFKNFLLSLSGKIDETRDNEIWEAKNADRAYQDCVYRCEEAQNRLSYLQSEEKLLCNCHNEYFTLLEEKKQLLIQVGSINADQIVILSERIDTLTNRLKEIKEALNAGNNVIDSLENALSSLNSANDYSTWDLIGGGLIADCAKHSHLDEAKSNIHRAEMAITKFKTELSDINMSLDSVDISEVEGFNKFADFFFDGIFADLNMANKIENLSSQVSDAKKQINRTVQKLRLAEQTDQADLKKAKTTLESLILESGDNQ